MCVKHVIKLLSDHLYISEHVDSLYKKSCYAESTICIKI